MRMFHRKSNWERFMEAVATVTPLGAARRAGKVTLGLLGGAATATAISAAVSSARRRSEK
jgi:hypothetical protein